MSNDPEPTFKNLLMQAKLRESLKVVEPNETEATQVQKALCDLQINWDEVNETAEENHHKYMESVKWLEKYHVAGKDEELELEEQ